MTPAGHLGPTAHSSCHEPLNSVRPHALCFRTPGRAATHPLTTHPFPPQLRNRVVLNANLGAATGALPKAQDAAAATPSPSPPPPPAQPPGGKEYRIVDGPGGRLQAVALPWRAVQAALMAEIPPEDIKLAHALTGLTLPEGAAGGGGGPALLTFQVGAARVERARASNTGLWLPPSNTQRAKCKLSV